MITCSGPKMSVITNSASLAVTLILLFGEHLQARAHSDGDDPAFSFEQCRPNPAVASEFMRKNI